MNLTPDHQTAIETARRSNGQFGEQHHAEAPTPDTIYEDYPQDPHGLADADFQATLDNFGIEAENAPVADPEDDGSQYSRLMWGVAEHISRTHPSGYKLDLEMVRETDMPDRLTGFVCGLKVHTAAGSFTMMRDPLDIDRSYVPVPDAPSGLPYSGFDSVKSTHTALLGLYEELVADANANGFTPAL